MIKKEQKPEKILKHLVWFGEKFAIANPVGLMIFTGTVIEDSNILEYMDEKGYNFVANIGGCLHFKKRI